MRDNISKQRAMQLHPVIRDEVVTIINKIEASFPSYIAVRIVQGLRTIEEQNELYAQGRTKPGKIVTNAKGGSSYHNYGLALDFALLYDKDKNGSFETLSWDLVKDLDRDGKKDWMEVVDAFMKHGYEWGGNFKTLTDNPHLQKRWGNSWQTLLARYQRKDFYKDTRYVRV